MAHLKKSAATGHLLKTAAGHLSKGCSNPWSVCACGYGTARVVISGVTECACGATTNYWGVNGTVDGTYDLPYFSTTGSTCIYKLTPTDITLRQYDDAGCTNQVGEIDTVIELRVDDFFGGQIVYLQFGGVGLTPGSTVLFYRAQNDAVTDCVTGTSGLDSEHSSCGVSVLATGGTATLTFL